METAEDNKALRDRRIEMINRHEVISQALKRGYNAFTAVVDDGIDFILHRFSQEADCIFKVQLKSRFTISWKYERRGIWIAFPKGEIEDAKRQWYLAPHDEMARFADRNNTSKSWKVHREYSSVWPQNMQEMLNSYLLEEVLTRSPLPYSHPWPLSHTGEGKREM